LDLIHTGTSPDTITDVYRAHLNHTQSQLNNMITNDSLNTSFDFIYTGISAQSNVNTTLEYTIHQGGTQVGNDTVPVSITVTPFMCVNDTSTYPIDIDLANVTAGYFLLKIFLNGNLIAEYVLLKENTNSADENKNYFPSGFSLYQNYPNPFNPGTTISFTQSKMSQVNIKIFDVTGRLIKTIVRGREFSRGSHSVYWNGTNQQGKKVGSGIYFVGFSANTFWDMKRMLLLK